MKKNKILAGISALVMGATMMAGTAMSASAYSYNGYQVGFCTAAGHAPHGMWDGNIANITYDSTVGKYKVTLQVADYTTPYGNVTGYISALKETDGTPLTIYDISYVTSTSEADDYAGYVYLEKDHDYLLTGTTVSGYNFHTDMAVNFTFE